MESALNIPIIIMIEVNTRIILENPRTSIPFVSLLNINIGTPPIYLPKVSKVLNKVTMNKENQGELAGMKLKLVAQITPGNTTNVIARLKPM